MRYTETLPPKLEDMRALLYALGDPQDAFSYIHIAGTNGKGSTAAFLFSILRAGNYRTGLFTSPHLFRYNERIRVDEEEIPDAALNRILAFVEEKTAALCIKPNYFRTATAAALVYFREQNVQFAVIEAGMGGRLDPTNALASPALSIITRIGLDHMEFLGRTLEEIAREKAGIFKAGVPALTIHQDALVERTLIDAARMRGAHLRIVAPLHVECKGQRFLLHSDLGTLQMQTGGLYQGENAALALAAARALQERGVRILDEAIYTGLSASYWAARFELVQKDPPVLFDGAHNENGAAALMQSIEACYSKAVFIMGFMKDKHYMPSILHAAKLARAMIAVSPPDERGLNADALAQEMLPYCAQTFAARDMAHALAIAYPLLKAHDVVCVFGSLYLLSTLKEALKTVSSTVPDR